MTAYQNTFTCSTLHLYGIAPSVPINQSIHKCIDIMGAGGLDLGMGKIKFDAVFDRKKFKLSDAFYGIKKYCS